MIKFLMEFEENLHTELKIAAAKKKQSMRQFINEAVINSIEEDKKNGTN